MAYIVVYHANYLRLIFMLITGPAEFCQWEDFEAPCADDEMIVIRNAIYGRMRQSRCAQRDFGYLGCETDVLDRMHRECSGRHLCTFKVTNLHDSVTCPKDLTAYLAISYDCTKGGKTLCVFGLNQ